ncbi:MAG: 50S ribosomal protein L24 [bacterium]|nr:50S ribosomal protein L24 [bacterium]
MKIKKSDTVLIISGKDKGKKSKVLQVFPEEKRVLVEGVNIRKKHQKPKKSGEKGQIIELPGRISISNIKLICPKCAKAARVGYKIINAQKYRICKKCGQEIA